MAKQPSLAAQSGTLQTAPPALPSIFSAPAEDIKGRVWPPYVTFAHNKRKDEYAKIIGAIKRPPDEHDMFLIDNDTVVQLPVLKASWLVGKQWWQLGDEAGTNVTDVVYEERPRPYREIIEAVLLVYLPDRIVPANIQFRSTKCPAGKAMFDAAKAAADSEAWAALSPAHRETIAIKEPFWRFFGNIQVQPPRPPKGGGQPYRPTSCEIVPTGVAEWRLMSEFNKDVAAAEKALKTAAERYQSQISGAEAIFRKKQMAAKQ